jgi:hypothetical protein
VPDADERTGMISELQQLRRGHGLHSQDLMFRVGPQLKRICDLDSLATLGERRDRLVLRLGDSVKGLPDDLRLAVQAAFALPPADQSRFLRERMLWLGRQFDRDPRTAMRRVESGLALLAERLLADQRDGPAKEDVYAPEGWFVDSFRATLMMHVDPVQLIETRRVSSTRNGLEQITVSWSIPADTPEALAGLRVDMLYGGELRSDEETSTSTFWSGQVHLPQALNAGDQHEFQVRVTSLPRQLFRPYYVLTPFRRCDEFILRAKFDQSDPPAQIWTLDGVPFQLLDENQPVGMVLEPDPVGEVESHFHDLRQGLSYGLRWRYDRAGTA